MNKLKFIISFIVLMLIVLACGLTPCKTNEFNIQISQDRPYPYEGYYMTHKGKTEKQVKIDGMNDQTILVNSEKLYVSIQKTYERESELTVKVYDKDWNLLKSGSTNKQYGIVSFWVDCY